MASDADITSYLERLKAGDEAACSRVCERYYEWLVRLARCRLAGLGRRDRDEDDIAQSALATFFRRAAQGQFTELAQQDDLEKLLCKITVCKALKERRRQLTLRRGGGKVRGESALGISPDGDPIGMGHVPDDEDDQLQRVEQEELIEQLCAALGDSSLQQVLLLRVAGYTVREIAEMLDTPIKRVEYKLQRIRRKLEPMLQQSMTEAGDVVAS
jgi:RNA polymerase sigma factor (sigma-70 family)